MNGHQLYVLGFAFTTDGRVALIQKKRPAWQAGRLNGIGGKVEGTEHSAAAMVREFREETGVDTPEKADIAIVRLNTPWIPVETDIPMAKGFHHGDLDFKGKDLQDVLDICKAVPTVVDMYLDRPAVFPEINAAARAVLANYGASDEAVMDVIFGKARPEGKLPFELPSSMEAVRNQKPDVPHDSKDPLYPFGFGLKY